MITRPLVFSLIALLAVAGAALPGVSRAEDAMVITVTAPPAATPAPAVAPAKTVVKKKTVQKKSSKKTVQQSKTKAKSAVKTVAKKAPVKTAAVKPPVSLSAVPVVEEPKLVTAAAHTRSMAEMATPPAGAGSAATQVVRQFYDQLTETMKQGDRLGFSGRYAKLQTAMERSFNLDEMMRTAAGPSWTEATPQQQKQLASAFHTFSISNYANRFPRYGGEQFEVSGERCVCERHHFRNGHPPFGIWLDPAP
ncbi:MAG: ABC transporter substrate-binding protein [Proteobacteria bacterium]|nr:ABC transporter substrate-binding protein [Pseudomonadota bacterium]